MTANGGKQCSLATARAKPQIPGSGMAHSGTQVATTGPTAKASPALAYDSARHRVVLFGGDDCSGLLQGGDTWEWDGTTWLQVATTGPGPRGGATAMAYDRARGQVVLFGGAAPDTPDKGDTWTWLGPIYRCSTVIPGDINCDGVVDRDDLNIVRTSRGTQACAPDDPRDLNGDGRISFRDVLALGLLCTQPRCAIE